MLFLCAKTQGGQKTSRFRGKKVPNVTESQNLRFFFICI